MSWEETVKFGTRLPRAPTRSTPDVRTPSSQNTSILKLGLAATAYRTCNKTAPRQSAIEVISPITGLLLVMKDDVILKRRGCSPIISSSTPQMWRRSHYACLGEGGATSTISSTAAIVAAASASSIVPTRTGSRMRSMAGRFDHSYTSTSRHRSRR